MSPVSISISHIKPHFSVLCTLIQSHFTGVCVVWRDQNVFKRTLMRLWNLATLWDQVFIFHFTLNIEHSGIIFYTSIHIWQAVWMWNYIFTYFTFTFSYVELFFTSIHIWQAGKLLYFHIFLHLLFHIFSSQLCQYSKLFSVLSSIFIQILLIK